MFFVFLGFFPFHLYKTTFIAGADIAFSHHQTFPNAVYNNLFRGKESDKHTYNARHRSSLHNNYSHIYSIYIMSVSIL